MRSLTLVLIAAATAAVAACGSSSSTTSATAPSTVARCGVTISANTVNIAASGGTGTLSVTTPRECSWTASSTAGWLTMNGSSSGQGDGSVNYVVAANGDPATRQATIEINDQQARVVQSGADCEISLQDSSASFSPAGGSGNIVVRASSGQCVWTATSEADWITVRSGNNGTGNGSVGFSVDAAGGTPRAGTILVGGLRFSVVQSQSCTYSVSPGSISVPSAGGTSNVSINTSAGCPWTSSSNVAWASIAQGTTGSGPGVAQVVVNGASGPTRSGSVVIAGQLVPITQSAGCSLSVNVPTSSFGAGGGSGSAGVSGAAGCDWSASADVPWITFSGATSGSGNGTVNFSVGPTSGPSRTGTLNIAGTQVSITQSGGCSITVAPVNPQVGAAGGNVSITVTAGDGCAWSTSTGVPWITIAAGASGSGNGTVTLSVAASNGGERSGSVVIGGQTVTVNQGNGCTFSIAPTSASAPSGASSGSVTVSAGNGCSWAVGSNASWLTLASTAGGSGNGTVQYNVAANTGAARSGTLSIAGQPFTVNQAAGCSYSLAPTSISIPAAGSKGSVSVTTAAGCPWTASSGASWISVTSGASGNGPGTVQYDASASTVPPRSTTLTIAGLPFAVSQVDGCTFDVSPTNASAKGAGDTVSVTVKASDPACSWSVSSAVSWIVPSFTGTRSGNGTLELRISPNPGAQRQGTATIANQDVRIVQQPN